MFAMRRVVLTGGIIGLLVSGVLLVLDVFGLSGVLVIRGDIDLMYVLSPSFLLLPVHWGRTGLGITITAVSVAITCAMYIAIALVLRAGFELFRKT